MIEAATFTFLKSLKKNNNREWFDKNRHRYEAARENMCALVQDVIGELSKTDETIAELVAKDCMYRIYRDVRFREDKTPYKTHMTASLIMGGKKTPHAGYYLSVEPGLSEIGGGRYLMEPDVMKKIRQEIDYSWDEFQSIIRHKNFVSFFKDIDRSPELSLSREPKGYAKDNPAIDYIKLKSWIALKTFTDEEMMQKGIAKKIAKHLAALHPLVTFLNRAIVD